MLWGAPHHSLPADLAWPQVLTQKHQSAICMACQVLLLEHWRCHQKVFELIKSHFTSVIPSHLIWIFALCKFSKWFSNSREVWDKATVISCQTQKYPYIILVFWSWISLYSIQFLKIWSHLSTSYHMT